MTRLRQSSLARVYVRNGLIGFGGPAAQIALIRRELVEERAWPIEKQFLKALSFCMMLPGPEAMQLCTCAGWQIQDAADGLVAVLLFALPDAAAMMLLTAI